MGIKAQRWHSYVKAKNTGGDYFFYLARVRGEKSPAVKTRHSSPAPMKLGDGGCVLRGKRAEWVAKWGCRRADRTMRGTAKSFWLGVSL